VLEGGGGNIIRVRFDDPEAEPYTLRIASVEEGVLWIRRWWKKGATLSGTEEGAGV